MSYKDIIDNIPKDTNIDEIKTKYKELLDVISNIEHLDNTTILKVLLDFDKRLTAVAIEKAGVEDIVNVEFIPVENGLTYADGVADYLGSLQITLLDNIIRKDCSVRLNIKGSESIIVDVDESDNALEIHIDRNITSKIDRSLLSPLIAPTETKLVGVNESNSQEMLSLDITDFEIDNKIIKLKQKYANIVENATPNNLASFDANGNLQDGGYSVNNTQTGFPGNKVPLVNNNGVMDVGKYLDFHEIDNTGDFSTRLMSNGNNNNTVSLPSASGTLGLTSQINSISMCPNKTNAISNPFTGTDGSTNYTWTAPDNGVLYLSWLSAQNGTRADILVNSSVQLVKTQATGYAYDMAIIPLAAGDVVTINFNANGIAGWHWSIFLKGITI